MKNRQIISSVGWILYFVVIAFALYTGFLCNFVYNEIGLLLILILGVGAAVWSNMGEKPMYETIVSPKTLKMFLGIYGVILLVVLFGMRYSASDVHIVFSSDYIKYNSNLIPFTTILNDLSANNWKVSIGNLLLFIPIGVLCPMIWKSQRKKSCFFITVLIVSLLIEGIQVITGLGSFDVDDMICYLIGSIFGFMLWVMIERRKLESSRTID